MKVLFWTASFWPQLGGLEVISCELVRTLQKRGVDFTVLTALREEETAPTGPESWEGIPLYRLAASERDLVDFSTLSRVRHQVLKLKRRFRPDLIHINGIGLALPMMLLCAEPDDPPRLVTLHGDWDGYRPQAIKALFEQSAWIAACSQDTLRVVHEFAPQVRGKSSVLLNAIPEISLAAPPDAGHPYLLCAGRLAPEKQFDMAVRALARLEQIPRLRLHIAGTGIEQDFLQALAGSLGLESRVIFLGSLDRARLAQQMRGALAILVPSRVEGFGLVALEAAQQGRPVLASRVGGLVEVVCHGETGLLLDSNDVGEWVGAIEQLWRNPELGEQMGREARRRARQKFVWDDFARGYLDLYQRLVAG